jgi:hypothetical protein
VAALALFLRHGRALLPYHRVLAGDVTEDAMQRMSSSVGALQARLTSFAAAVAASVASMKSTAAAASTEASDRIADLQ